MQLSVVFEIGKFGKRVCRVFLKREDAERILKGMNSHYFKVEEINVPSEYSAQFELFAAHTYDKNYDIHRFTSFHSSYGDALRGAGDGGLVLAVVPE